MHEILHSMLHAVEHTLWDTAKLFPFLFLSYLLMEFLEHKSSDVTLRYLSRSGKVGPLVGGALGALPQCGFSAAASGLYTGRIITTGTLIAVYLSTSDEMLPILISEGASLSFILKILGAKLLIGVLAGFAVDLISRLLRRGGNAQEQTRIEELCEREGCRCGEHFLLSALRHTLRVTVFVLALGFVLNFGVELLGEDRLGAFVLNRPVLANLLASLVGLIPNCASSVVLTELYLGGVLSVGGMLSGLLVNAGIGLALLFRNNRPVGDSFRILLILWAVGVAAGIVVDLTPLGTFLSI